jgi:hypothetical protein
MHRIYLPLLLISSVCWTLHAQDAHTIIDNYFNSVSNGNRDNWNKIKSAYIESISSYNQRAADKQLPNFVAQKPKTHKLFIVWPDKCKDELYEDSTLVSTFYHNKKNHFFVMGNMPPMPVTPHEKEPFYEFFPVTLKKMLESDPSIVAVGMQELEGDQYHHIRIETSSVTWNLYFSTETYLLGYWNNNFFGDSITMTKVDKYERIDEYLIPTLEVKTREGIPFFWDEIKKIQLNVIFDDKIFQVKAK